MLEKYNENSKDWIAFSKFYVKRNGFPPIWIDDEHQELFVFFIAGAHAEHIGRI